MLVKPTTPHGHSRRHSSGTHSLSSSPIDTFKRAASRRSTSASRNYGSTLPAGMMPQDSRSARTSSPSTKIRSRSSARKSEDGAEAGHSNANRWSHSTSSSISTANNTHHRRTSSVSRKRFSLGMSSLNALSGRSLSPSKKSRPTDEPPAVAYTSPIKPNNRNITIPSSQSELASSSHIPAPNRLMQPSKIPSSTSSSIGYGKPDRQVQPVSSRVQHWNQRAQQASEASSPPQATSPAAHRRVPGHQANSASQESSGKSEQGATSPQRPRSRREKDKKQMLTKALQRANDAVDLDHQSKHDAAILAYQDACELLAQVLARSTSEVDRSRLITIRTTYTGRIEELQNLQGSGSTSVVKSHSNSKATDPAAHQEVRKSLQAMAGTEEHPFTSFSDTYGRPSTAGTTSTSTATPGSPESATRGRAVSPTKPLYATLQDRAAAANIVKDRPLIQHHQPLKPRPLSPRQSPTRESPLEPPTIAMGSSKDARRAPDHRSQPSDGDLTWLQSMQKDARSSQGSSHHSRSSETGLHRKHIRLHSDQTAADFDAAFDAAVEAAYDDGYEPYSDSANHSRESSGNVTGGTPPTQRFSRTAPAPLAPQRQLNVDSSMQPPVPRQSGSSGFSGRTQVSSTGSGVTTTGTSFSTMDAKASRSPAISMSPKSAQVESLPPQQPPPSSHLPKLPTSLPVRPVSPGTSLAGGSVRDRRLDGQKAMKLKIETTAAQSVEEDTAPLSDQDKPPPLPKNSPPVPQLSTIPPRSTPTTADDTRLKPQTAAVPLGLQNISSPFPSPLPGMFNRARSAETTSTLSPNNATLPSAVSPDSSGYGPSPQSEGLVTPFSATSKASLKKNPSSLSLRSKSTLAPSIDEIEFSPATPLSLPFSASSATARKAPYFPGQPANTPVVGNFNHAQAPTSYPGRASGTTLFDTDYHVSDRPTSPNSSQKDQPRQFEPCPNSNLLRPFWLMRLLHLTIVHPRGGYLTTECFIPREVWEMKNVKLKGVEEKISACDLLSAALLKLSTVNTLDADAVLSEMQALENVLDVAQTALSKKLGSDVGVQGISSFFKDAPSNSNRVGDANDAARRGDNDRTSGTKTSSKTYLNSWRKLRNKSSSNSMNSSYTNIREGPKEEMNMKSVPITMNLAISSRHRGRDFTPVEPKGPNASYAGALAKLCDAAQVLDQVARQVEDPGLRHSSPTHVGLELSTRHAAEFFGFYICRFILQDLQMLADKHVKRATEWVVT